MALPRIATRGGSNVVLPRPLAPSEVARIKLIFGLQARGRIPDAVAETTRLDDVSLLGHILADRHLKQHSRNDLPC